jgi:hypothetical protein
MPVYTEKAVVRNHLLATERQAAGEAAAKALARSRTFADGVNLSARRGPLWVMIAA